MLKKRHNVALEVFYVDGLRFMDKDDEHKEGDFVLLDS